MKVEDGAGDTGTDRVLGDAGTARVMAAAQAYRLTRRQTEVLLHVSCGRANKEIARALAAKPKLLVLDEPTEEIGRASCRERV